jgi:hypothetical protein
MRQGTTRQLDGYDASPFAKGFSDGAAGRYALRHVGSVESIDVRCVQAARYTIASDPLLPTPCAIPACDNDRSRGVAQPGSAPALGAGGRWFESSRPDHSFEGICSKNIEGWQLLPTGLLLYEGKRFSGFLHHSRASRLTTRITTKPPATCDAPAARVVLRTRSRAASSLPRRLGTNA